MSLKKVIASLKKENNFLITSHVNLEGDALGSQIGLYYLLKAIGKRAVIVDDDTIPYGYEFLPEGKIIKRFRRGKTKIDFDCLVILDCSDLRRAGEVGKIDLKGKAVINIDHHISNEIFADVNWVEPDTSSASEMVYKLYKKMGVPFEKNSALALYVGILTDTGSFHYSNTSGATHRAAAELMECGLKVNAIYRQIYETIPFSDMKLLGNILPGIKRAFAGRVVWFELERKLWAGKKISFDLSEHILSFGRAIEGVEVVCLFKENLGAKNEIRVNFRSHGRVDVNKIARIFGGGGHKTAAGATIHGRLPVVRSKVLSKVKAAVAAI
ncbi:MAG: bifunctional oligoribonuclease/PAP phosphatase NrnA [Candidatus Omnitrophica bacterium]|nr:bifunctional oligoribonuclease/PAP phosphatase NrnA [Candidatus Omnitrophota bacterium]MDD5653071.1 bifunctional oligoribonuclease/PAP phosphatase NrnA [Candidatus Omnitrophota bacterium]